MSDVKKISPVGNIYGWEESEFGEFVLSEDYDALEAEAQALREEVAALRARVVVPEDLLQRCREILEWQATGILKGDALRSYCQSKIWGRDPSALRMGEGETAQEAYRFIDELARLNGKAVSEGLLRKWLELMEHGDYREGHCMCGSSVDGHGIGDGHAPVDAGEYYAGQVMEELRDLLGDGKEVCDANPADA
jgi:hypothetical protein